MQVETVHKLEGQKIVDDEYKDTDVLLYMAVVMEVIKENLMSCQEIKKIYA